MITLLLLSVQLSQVGVFTDLIVNGTRYRGTVQFAASGFDFTLNEQRQVVLTPKAPPPVQADNRWQASVALPGYYLTGFSEPGQPVYVATEACTVVGFAGFGRSPDPVGNVRVSLSRTSAASGTSATPAGGVTLDSSGRFVGPTLNLRLQPGDMLHLVDGSRQSGPAAFFESLTLTLDIRR